METDDLFGVFDAGEVAEADVDVSEVALNSNNTIPGSVNGSKRARGEQGGRQPREKRARVPLIESKIETETIDTIENNEGRPLIAEDVVVDLAGEAVDPIERGIDNGKSVRHQVAVPPNYDYIPLASHTPPATPARIYPFTLDPFQTTAIACIERAESVLVAAHTSAGKTVVAEYAIALSLGRKQRVVYTSPIKALSNQKYRELLQDFGDVGLMTGDVTINPSASCLVMTTEILRSMLYRGSEIMREVAWVIFDEVHYMRDKDRGVVWEETLILLPDTVHYVFLSATIPNALQFAEWICKMHTQPCHVVYTDFRPTPLQHYLFPSGADRIHLVVDEKSVFREDNFQRAIGAVVEKDGDDNQRRIAKKKGPQEKKRTFLVFFGELSSVGRTLVSSSLAGFLPEGHLRYHFAST